MTLVEKDPSPSARWSSKAHSFASELEFASDPLEEVRPVLEPGGSSFRSFVLELAVFWELRMSGIPWPSAFSFKIFKVVSFSPCRSPIQAACCRISCKAPEKRNAVKGLAKQT